MTPIPQSPAAVRGYVNLRGQIVLALDLQSLLLQRPTPIGDDIRLVVFRPCLGDPFGILVNRVGDIVALHDERIETCMAGSLANGGEKRAAGRTTDRWHREIRRRIAVDPRCP